MKLPNSWRSWPERDKRKLLEALKAEAERRGVLGTPQRSEDWQALSFADLVIRTKDKRMISFAPNAVQRKYLDTILPNWRTGDFTMSGLREIILKFRQPGFSTLILALYFLDTINTPNTYTVVLAHDLESTQNLFEMVQRFYDNLPADRRPRTKYANRREYVWPDLGSRFFVGTAGSGGFARGTTINNVHGSEVAQWPNGEKIAAGLLQAVPNHGNIFLESTAEGMGNFFHNEYSDAKAGKSDYKARFFAWFEFPEEYATSVREEFYEDERVTPKQLKAENTLQLAYNVTDEQLQWRRDKMREPGMRDKFAQEYPSNDREAFVSSGNPYFDVERLDVAAALLETSADSIEAIEASVVIPSQFRRLRATYESGQLHVYKAPVEGRKYTIGADTAEGLNDFGKHDFDSADVLDAESWEQVAHLNGQWDTHEYGLMLAELGFWYNTALMGIERNNHGHAVINAALHTGDYPPARSDNDGGMYFHQEYDETKKFKSRRPGWPTSSRSKNFVLDDLAAAILEDDLQINCLETFAELMTFIKLPGGRAGGEKGSQDDRVISLALAVAMLKLRPRRVAVEEPDSTVESTWI